MLLLNAASTGDAHLVQHCLEVGVAVNCKDKVGPPLQPRHVPHPDGLPVPFSPFGSVPMCSASWHSDLPPPPLAHVVQDGSTPLHLAARNEKLEVVSLLLSSKANLEATNKVRAHD
jgi:hypothetical protein